MSGYIYVVEDDLKIEANEDGSGLISFEIEDNCYVQKTFIGTTITKEITIKFYNTNSEINLENKTVQAFVGVDDEYIPFGTFIIQDFDNKESTEIATATGYDYMSKFDDNYVDDNTYPVTLQTFFKNLCTQVGLEVGSTSIVNKNYKVQGNPFTNNETCRTVLSSIAQIGAGFARIGRDDKVYIVNLEDVTEEAESLDKNNYGDDFDKNDKYGEINQLTITLDENVDGESNTIRDVESIAENGLTEIVISENYILSNEEERLKVIDNIWNALKGKYYIPFSVSYYGYPWLDAGDPILISDTKDNVYESYVFNHTFTYNGAFSGEISTEALTDVQSQYVNTNDISNVFRNVQLTVDKINGQITTIIEENSKYYNQLTQITQTVNELSETVSSLQIFSREVTSLNYISIFDCAEGSGGYIVDFIIYGNTELFTTNEITISSSTQPRGYGENISIDTEDGEAILTEDDIELFVGVRGYTLDWITLTLDGILNSLTVGDETYYDTLEVAQDGTITQIRIIGNHYATTSCDIYGGTTNVSLTTEDGEDLTTEDGDTILNEYESESEVVGRLTEGTYVFVYEVQGDRARIGDNEWVDTSYLASGYGLLNEAIVTVLEETFVIPTTEEVYLFVEELAGLKYYAKYIIKNDYTDLFATKVELSSAITQTAEEFRIEMTKKVDEDEICSVISQSAEQITLSGNRVVIDSTYFKLDEEGNVTLCGTIYDDEGNVLVSKNGVLTNIQIQGVVNDDGLSGGGKHLLGYYFTGGSGIALEYSTIQAFVPSNFTIFKAYITIRHTPVMFDYYDSWESTSKTVTGSAHCVQAYVVNDSNYKYYAVNSDSGMGISQVSGTETTLFGENGKTFSTKEAESAVSEDVTKYLTSGKVTEFIIASPKIQVEYNSSTTAYTTYVDFPGEGKVTFDEYTPYTYTGDVTVTLNIYGYMSYVE